MGPMVKDGMKGENGKPGPQGSLGPRNGGVVFTRWGRTTCPTTNDTELLYQGKAAGSHFDQYEVEQLHLVAYLMIPAKTTCPKTWTRTTEYQGYLMAELNENKRNAVYECVIKILNLFQAVLLTLMVLYSIMFVLNVMVSLSSYDKVKELACVELECYLRFRKNPINWVIIWNFKGEGEGPISSTKVAFGGDIERHKME
ncbi:uncharacterized protein LOC121392083 [Gigantopelta aegis]|uniref:uncharacterized protein LOC121392083 n=1 Tax=Gigantopelta aegis TaxID=1735272 RepID=UPI001B88A951|nr:uncharacterized protein LOC121392083 [Gigantopelta aegis]